MILFLLLIAVKQSQQILLTHVMGGNGKIQQVVFSANTDGDNWCSADAQFVKGICHMYFTKHHQCLDAFTENAVDRIIIRISRKLMMISVIIRIIQLYGIQDLTLIRMITQR